MQCAILACFGILTWLSGTVARIYLNNDLFSKTIDSADSAILQVDDSGIDLKRLCAAIATFEEASKRERTNPAIFSDLLQISTSFLSNYVCMISICILSLEQRHAFTRDVNFTIGQKSEHFRPRGSADTNQDHQSGPERGCQGSPSAVFPSSSLKHPEAILKHRWL